MENGPGARASCGAADHIKGLPSGYNKDLQEDKQAVFDSEDTDPRQPGVVKSVVRGLTLNRPRTDLRLVLLLATDVADSLVAGDCRSGAPTRSSGPSSGSWLRRAGSSGRSVWRNGAREATCSVPTLSTESRPVSPWRPSGRHSRPPRPPFATP